jgi:hypothetical protein
VQYKIPNGISPKANRRKSEARVLLPPDEEEKDICCPWVALEIAFFDPYHMI